MITLEYDNALQEADLKENARGAIDSQAGFEAAVTASLFSWRRDPDADVAETGQRFGWWGDGLGEDPEDRFGSHLWRLRRERVSLAVMRTLQRYIEDALQWMIDDGIASGVQVTTERLSTNAIAARIEITRSSGQQWAGIWDIHLNRL